MNWSEGNFVNNRLVSIGLLTYNRPLSFKKALDSLVSQSYKNIEIIIGDNSENNETEKIYKKYIKDKRIKYYKHNENIGMMANYKFVLDLAKGKYFMWSSDDDYWDNTFIEKAVQKLEGCPAAAACWPSINFFDENGTILLRPDIDNQDLSNDTIIKRLLKANLRGISAQVYCLIKTDIAKEFSFDNYQIVGIDVVFVNHLLLSGKCLMINEPLFNYKLSSTSAYERHNYKSTIYNEYARINPRLDLFIKCFQLILRSKKINIFQKFLYFTRYWFNLIFINQRNFIPFYDYPIFKFFNLVIKKRNYNIIWICFPLLLLLLPLFFYKKLKDFLKR